MPRHLVLPARGVLLVNTDVHGNLEDFERVANIFAAESAREAETHWVILGDIVHAPDDTARRSDPVLYGYPDGSMEIVDRILAAEKAAPRRVHFVLGNHDHGHVGGPHTHKFLTDEVTALEATLSAPQRARMTELFGRALLAVAAPCGVLLTHGSPDDSLTSLSELDDAPLLLSAMTSRQSGMLRSLLTSYGQPEEVTTRMLASVSRASALDLRVVIHGHDRDEKGYFREGTNQVCPVVFGARRENKRYVRLDLGARYETAEALREDVEILRLYRQ